MTTPAIRQPFPLLHGHWFLCQPQAGLRLAARFCMLAFVAGMVLPMPTSRARPASVEGSSATASNFALNLRWTDNSSVEAGFEIERAPSVHVGSQSIGAWTQIATVGPNITDYSDSDLLPATTFFYRVRAFNSYGYSDYSEVVAGTTPLPPVEPNTPPIISGIADLAIQENVSTGPMDLAVSDAQTASNLLDLSGTSSNLELVPTANIIFGGTGSSRTVTVTPSTNQTGTATITLGVSDGTLTSSTSFLLSVEKTSVPPLFPPAGGLVNLSTRAMCGTDEQLLIAGFVIGGTANMRLLIRSVGPTLAEYPFDLPNVLPNPRILLKRWNGTVYVDIASNDDWNTNTDIRNASRDVAAFALREDGKDAALLVDLPPGQYSALTDDPIGNSGIAIVELYDTKSSSASASKMLNLSTRGYVGLGTEVLILGFVVEHESAATLLIRAVGPTLADAPFNIPGTLPDPELQLFRRDRDGIETLVLSNDDWGNESASHHTAQVAELVSAFRLSEGGKDAAIVATLTPAVYTVVTRGVNGSVGLALVELYWVP